MAEDGDISRRYRELAREEPPHPLDDAILAAARRAVHTRPAPLVVPTGRQRWYFPLAAAAIIVLAVAVTVQVERQQPSEEIVTAPAAPAASPPAPRELMREEAQAEKAKPETRQPAPQPERRRKTESADSRELRDAAPPPAPIAVPPAPPPVATQDAINAQRSASGAFMGSAENAPQASAEAAARAESARTQGPRQSSALAKLAEAPLPEQWLQGIADLRRQGRHEEADQALAEFRKRYPSYKIPEAMLEKVEKR